MNGYGCYLMYLSIKAHFGQDAYDYFKYNGKVKANQRSFEKRNDRYFFEKLAKKLCDKKEFEMFFVATFVYSPSVWIGGVFTEEYYDSFNHVKGYLKNTEYLFRQDLLSVFDLVESKEDILTLFSPVGNKPPLLLQNIQQGKIALESFLILDKQMKLLSRWNKEIKDTVLWPMLYKKWSKYQPFLMSFLTETQSTAIRGMFKEIVCDRIKNVL